MTWLLRTAAHLIADPGEGETPVPPLTVSDIAAKSAEQGQADVLFELSCTLLDNAALCADPAVVNVISPRWADGWLEAECGSTVCAQKLLDACRLGSS